MAGKSVNEKKHFNMISFDQRTFSEGHLLLNRNNWYQFLVFVLCHIIVTATAHPFVTFFLIQPTNLPTPIYRRPTFIYTAYHPSHAFPPKVRRSTLELVSYLLTYCVVIPIING